MFDGVPTTWQSPAPMSTLHIILLFAGVPLLVIVTIALLVYAPSWVKGPRYRPGQQWDALPEWFGAPDSTEAAGLAPEAHRHELPPGSGRSPVALPSEHREPGGASANW